MAALPARSRCARPWPIRSTPSRSGSPSKSAPRPSPTWRSGSASPPAISTTPSMALGASEVRLIDMVRAYATRGARRGRRHALRHPPGDDGGRDADLPAPGRSVAGAAPALGRAADDRHAGRRRQPRHRPRRRSRPADRRQDRHHLVEQGRLVHRLFQRPHHRRLDGPRRQPRDSRLLRRPSAGAHLPRLHDPRRRPPPGRAVRDRRAGAGLADRRRREHDAGGGAARTIRRQLVDPDGGPIEDRSRRRTRTPMAATSPGPRSRCPKTIRKTTATSRPISRARPGAARRHDAAARPAPAAGPRPAAARPARGNRARGSYARGARPHAPPSRGGRNPAPGSAASCSGSCRCSSSCPSAKPDRRRRSEPPTTPASMANSRVSALEQRARLGLQPALHPAAEALGRAADQQPLAVERHPARPIRRPVDPPLDAAKRDRAPGANGSPRGSSASRCGDPALLLRRPGQRPAARRAARDGQHDLAAARIDAEPHPPRPRRLRAASPRRRRSAPQSSRSTR